MEEIIAPVSRELLKAELTPERRLRTTNKAGNELYIVTYQQAPNVVREIGRLREIAFRAAGGGTGLALDLDEFDTCDHPYYQLIVWCPEDEQILGGYRFLPGREIEYAEDGQPKLATGHMFKFSDQFIKDYMVDTVELGRSFVTLEYQSTRTSTKGLFALDNLWDGLGALTIVIPNLKYFFGKMTMYPSFNREARDMILYFLNKHFNDPDRLVYPTDPLQLDTDPAELEKLFTEETFREDYKILNTEVRKTGFNIPPLVNAYMGLSPTMRVFGTAVNHEFGEVEETGILIAIDEILEEKRMRHIDTFAELHPESARIFEDYFKKNEIVKG
ncbi:MAG: GNAT family N-acetyltransferase [Bacteroidaceae bacterium]|jgi:putative hemolysin|nr:GNAT family N-acetyltransferase [Bacteroidaceae bacterium]